MTPTTKSEKCAHPICNCSPQPGSDFCSAYCEGEGEIDDIVCNCGHSDCAEVRPIR